MADEGRDLPGSFHHAPHDLPAIGPVPADESITVSVYLKDRSADPLMEDAPQQDAHGSRAAMRQAREGEHADDIAAITSFAKQVGLEVVHVDAARRLVQLRGPASAMQTAFDTQMQHYQGKDRVIRGRTGALRLPASVVDRVSAVLGLDTTPFATPKIVPHRSPTPPAGFLPTKVAALYGFANLDATGQCIAIIELGGGYTDADNQAAFAAMARPVPKILAVAVDGGTNDPGDTSGADGEVALDIQVAGGVAPGATLAVYFAPNTSQGFVDAISQAVHDDTNRPSVVSISWGSPESEWSGQALTAMNAALKDAATVGVTVLAASGDALATDGETDRKAHVDYPASSPYVLGCGGTHIAASASAITGEIVWKSNGGGTGGGISALFPVPPYQTGAGVPKPKGGKAGRGVPDIAGNADPDSGYRIVTGGKTGIIGGTSAVAPLWAGLIAGFNAARGKPLGFVHATLYQHAAAFRDITQGDNKVDSVGFAAAKGWDACTGLGAPTAKLRTVLAKKVAA